ncbi:hypothetical protein evm_013191 [Chilo suppressalis]|nr:hypothetical protein evm_013191 [Chilo suppressalis]
MVNWSFVGAMFLPNVGGWISTLTMVGQVKKPDGTGWYQSLRKPSWTPPNWVFGPTWTVLYTTMGAASYMVYRDCGGFTDMAVVPLSLYGGQLVLNWIWTPLFFGCHKIGLGLVNMAVLNAAVVACTSSFGSVNRTAAYMMLPYLLWLWCATTLNYSIWKLNRDEKKER